MLRSDMSQAPNQDPSQPDPERDTRFGHSQTLLHSLADMAHAMAAIAVEQTRDAHTQAKALNTTPPDLTPRF